MLRVFLAALLTATMAMTGIATLDITAVATPAAQPAPAQDQAKDQPGGMPETLDQAYLAALHQSVGAPARADLGDQATVRLTGGMLVVPKDPAAHLLTLRAQPLPPDFAGLLVGSDGIDAPGIIRFVPDGFIDADTALAWTADDFLASLDDTVQRGNAARVKANQAELEARRWILPPSYDREAHQLVWSALIAPRTAPRGTDGEITIHAIGFGREGYVELCFVTSVEKADEVAGSANAFLQGLSFAAGKAYGDTQPADRRASRALAGAMGLDSLHRAAPAGSFWAFDTVVPLAGSTVAGIGTLALAIFIFRHMRRDARRG